METKQDVINEVNSYLGLPCLRTSSGSTEPKEFFENIVVLMALPSVHRSDKPGLARSIVEAAGFPWLPGYESRGSTVTVAGIKAVRAAVYLLLPPASHSSAGMDTA